MTIIKNQRLIDLREHKNLTQEQLATLSDVSQSMIARIELGEREPRKIIKQNLARFFKVSVEWLFYEQVDDFKSSDEQATTLDMEEGA